MQDAAVEWDPVSYGSAAVVQDASDRAVAQYSGPKTTLGWPPDEYIMAIVLSEREWTWLLQQMEIWHTGEGSDELKQVLIDALGDPTLS